MKPYANSSRLSHKAEILAKTGDSDEWGNPVWKSLGICWCDVRDRLGSETLVSSQNKRVSTRRTTFTMRSTPFTNAITPTMRISWHGQTHEILSGPVFTDDRNCVQFEGVAYY